MFIFISSLLKMSLISKFNSDEIDILYEFISRYTTSTEDILSMANDIDDIINFINQNPRRYYGDNIITMNYDINNKMYDPLFKYSDNFIAYILEVQNLIAEYYNGGRCVFLKTCESSHNVMAMHNEIINYVMSCVGNIDVFDDIYNIIDSATIIIMSPYSIDDDILDLYKQKSNVVISQMIPYTDNAELNGLIFNIWMKLMSDYACDND